MISKTDLLFFRDDVAKVEFEENNNLTNIYFQTVKLIESKKKDYK